MNAMYVAFFVAMLATAWAEPEAKADPKPEPAAQFLPFMEHASLLRGPAGKTTTMLRQDLTHYEGDVIAPEGPYTVPEVFAPPREAVLPTWEHGRSSIIAGPSGTIIAGSSGTVIASKESDIVPMLPTYAKPFLVEPSVRTFVRPVPQYYISKLPRHWGSLYLN